MLLPRLVYLLLFITGIWLALATREHPRWFHPLVVRYGGDIIWAGMFLFFLRAIFIKTRVSTLALACFALGVIVECSQLLEWDWLLAARENYIGRLALGVGFLWSDIVCYAIGTALAAGIVVLLDHRFTSTTGKRS